LTPNRHCDYLEVNIMTREMSSSVKRPRISIDVDPEIRCRIRLAAAKRDMIVRQYLLHAIESRLEEDLEDQEIRENILALTSKADPVLAELWDNDKDSAYDHL